MTVLEREVIRESGHDSTELPDRRRYNGPVSARRLRRSLAVYVVICAIGALPTVLGAGPAGQAFGLGMILPGGGFLVFSWWAAVGLAVTAVAFALALFAWFATGNVVAPVVVWLGAAVLAAVLAYSRAQPPHRFEPLVWALLIVAGIAVVAAMRRLRAVRRTARLRATRRDYLPAELAALQRRTVTAPPVDTPAELSPTQAAHLRWLIALGLQPVPEFDGFDVIEQFQPTALRYQINHLQYALAQAQRHFLPNFYGYLSEAQERLIEKLTVPKVWGYWRLERLWGRLSTDYDPAGFENIMFTGWSGICLNTYTANTGSDRFTRPAALEFTLGNPRKVYPHNAHTFNESLLWNFDRSPQILFACEPNWTYSACNIYGLNSVASYDAAFGTRHLDGLRERFLRALREEFMTPAGDIIPFRSDLTGVSVPFGSEAMVFQSAGWLAPVFPLLARTLWAIGCREILRTHEGGLDNYLKHPFALDPGNLRSTGLYARALIMLAAREFGDLEIAEAAEHAIDRHNEPIEEAGMRRYRHGSTLSNALVAHALFTRPGDWSRLITEPAPDTARTGPLLRQVDFDQAMVTQAVSDGADLRLVLRAVGDGSPRRVRLELDRLRPAAPYTAQADSGRVDFTSDAAGRAEVEIPVDARTAVRIVPAG